jgi:hypothetical protein
MLLPSYTVFGLVYRYQSVVRPVPLRGVSVDVGIVDFVVRTAIAQHFHNTEAFPIEAVYVFPLDERSAVCGFEIEIDGFGIHACVVGSRLQGHHKGRGPREAAGPRHIRERDRTW